MLLEQTQYKNNIRTVSGLAVTLFNNDVFIEVDTSGGPCSITLNEIPASNWNTVYKLYIYDKSNNASVNNITVSAPVGQEINQLASVVINENGGGLVVRILGENKYTGTFSYNTGGGPAGPDELVKATLTDTTAATLGQKLTVGAGLSTEILNSGADEVLKINYTGAITEVTFVELQALQLANNVSVGMLYHITDVIYTDLGVYTFGITPNRVSANAHGSFLNPDYQNIISGNVSGVWNIVTPPPLAAGVSLVCWNGSMWLSLTGATGSEPQTDPVNWLEKPRSTDPDLYAPEIDAVIYNQFLNWIMSRSDARENVVDYGTDGKGNISLEIGVFQWGRDQTSANKVLDNSIVFNVNTIGIFQQNLFINKSLCEALTSRGNIRYNTLANDSDIIATNLDGTALIEWNTVNQSSSIQAIDTTSNILHNSLMAASTVNIGTFTGAAFTHNILESIGFVNASSSTASITHNFIKNTILVAISSIGEIANNEFLNSNIDIENSTAAGTFRKNNISHSTVTATNLDGQFDNNVIDAAASLLATNKSNDFSRNTIVNQCNIDVSSSSAVVNDNVFNNASTLTATSASGTISSNTIEVNSSLNATNNTGTIYRNVITDNSFIDAENNTGTIGPQGDNTGSNIVRQRATINAKNNTGAFCSNQVLDFGLLDVASNGNLVQKNIVNGGVLIANSNTSIIQSCSVISGSINLGANTTLIERKAHYENTCNFEVTLDMADPAIYNLAQKKLTISVTNQQFGIVNLINGAGNTIELIQNISQFHNVTIVNQDTGNLTFTVVAVAAAVSVGQIIGSGSFTIVGRGGSKDDSAIFALNDIYAEVIQTNILT